MGGQMKQESADRHILICLSSSTSNAKVIHAAAKIAAAFQGSLTALFVETPAYSLMSDDDKKRLRSNMNLAEKLGAKLDTVIGDDAPIRNLISVTLEAHEYRHITAPNAGTAILEASSHNPDIMLLDLGLPDMDGVEVIRKVRSWSNLPIIVISARSDDTDKIEALDAGADDYLTKPFSVDELLARLRVTLRRLNQAQSDSPDTAVFSNGDLKIDYAAGCAYLQGGELHLTPIEYKLLCLLARNCGKVLTHKYITQQIWGAAWENNVASLRVFMATLRKKLEVSTGDTPYIQTHVGIGYRMVKMNE